MLVSKSCNYIIQGVDVTLNKKNWSEKFSDQ